MRSFTWLGECLWCWTTAWMKCMQGSWCWNFLYFACCAILLTSLQAERKISLCRPDFNHCLSARLLSRLASRSWGPTAQNQGEGGRLETLRWVAGTCWSRRFCSRRCSCTTESMVQKSSPAWRSDRKELWSMAAMFLASIYTAWGGGLKMLSWVRTEQWSDWRDDRWWQTGGCHRPSGQTQSRMWPDRWMGVVTDWQRLKESRRSINLEV